MARYKHATSGALVSVRDDKAMGSEWVPFDEKAAAEPSDIEKAPSPRATVKKAAAKPSDIEKAPSPRATVKKAAAKPSPDNE